MFLEKPQLCWSHCLEKLSFVRVALRQKGSLETAFEMCSKVGEPGLTATISLSFRNTTITIEIWMQTLRWLSLVPWSACRREPISLLPYLAAGR